MQNVAQAWLVYRLTGSALLLGSVTFAGQIPVFLTSPLGGIVADRYNRQKVVIATQAASMILAFAFAWLTLSNRITVNEVFYLAIVRGIVNAFDIPGRQAFLVEMVGKGRSDQCHRPQFVHVQWRTHDRPSDRWDRGRENWRGLVFLFRCCQLYRGHHWIVHDERLAPRNKTDRLSD